MCILWVLCCFFIWLSHWNNLIALCFDHWLADRESIMLQCWHPVTAPGNKESWVQSNSNSKQHKNYCLRLTKWVINRHINIIHSKGACCEGFRWLSDIFKKERTFERWVSDTHFRGSCSRLSTPQHDVFAHQTIFWYDCGHVYLSKYVIPKWQISISR